MPIEQTPEAPTFHQPLLQGPPCLSGALLSPGRPATPPPTPQCIGCAWESENSWRGPQRCPGAFHTLPVPDALMHPPWSLPSATSSLIFWPFLLVHPSALECLSVPLTQTKANTTGIYPGAPLLSSLLTAPPCVKCGQPQDFTPPSLGFLFHLIWFWGCVLHPLKSVSFPEAPSCVSHQGLSRFCCPDEGGNSQAHGDLWVLPPGDPPSLSLSPHGNWAGAGPPKSLGPGRGQPSSTPPHTAHSSWVPHPASQTDKCRRPLWLTNQNELSSVPGDSAPCKGQAWSGDPVSS